MTEDLNLTPEQTQKLKELLGMETAPKSWDSLTEDEKTGIAVQHLKNKGIVLPKVLPKKVKNEAGDAEEWSWPNNFPEEIKTIITGLEAQNTDRDNIIKAMQ